MTRECAPGARQVLASLATRRRPVYGLRYQTT